MANTHYIEFTVDHTKVPSDQTDFIVFLDFSQLGAGHGFWSRISASGGEIRCYNEAGTTEYAREIVDIDSTAETGEVHVKVSGTLSSTADQKIRVEYGDTGLSDYAVTATYGRNAVWSDSAIRAHLNEDPSGSAPQIIDSTGNGNDGTANGTMTSGDLVSGKIGQALDFDGDDDYINFGNDASLSLNNHSAFTISLWAYSAVAYQTIVLKEYEYSLDTRASAVFRIRLCNGFYNWETRIEGSAYDDGNWHYVTYVWTGTQVGLYVDASIDISFQDDGISSTSDASNDLQLGFSDNYEWSNPLDEFGIRFEEMSADWITTEYNNQNSPSTFYSVSAEQSIAGGTTGTIDQSLPSVTQTAAITQTQQIQGTQFLSGITQTASATESAPGITATADQALFTINQSATATQEQQGSIDHSFPTLNQAVSSTQQQQGQIDQTLPSLNQSGAVSVNAVTATGDQSLPSLIQSAASQQGQQGQVDQSFPALTQNATAELPFDASISQTLPSLSQSSNVQIAYQGTVSQTLNGITQSATAVLGAVTVQSIIELQGSLVRQYELQGSFVRTVELEGEIDD